MSRKHVIIAILLITAGLAVIGSFDGEVGADTTYSTLEVGSGKTYSTIQSAINAASSGDHIKVYAGTYNENVIVDKTLVIIGEGADFTIIDAGGSGSAMIVEEDYCRIEGLGFTGSGGESMEGFNAGLITKANNTLIQNCTFYDNYMGVLLRGGDHFTSNKMVYCEAYENVVHGIGTGVELTIQACYSHDNEGSGFWAFVTPRSILERCRAEENGYAGFQFDHTEDTVVKHFIARNNGNFGIRIGGGGVGNNNVVENCFLEGNGKGGIDISNVEGPFDLVRNYIHENSGPAINFSHGNYGSGFKITNNIVMNHTDRAIEIHDVDDDLAVGVYLNDIMSNSYTTQQGYDETTVSSWDMNSRGNFWSDWTTPDTDSDGIVDNPYSIDGSTSQKDNFPLTSSVSNSSANLLPTNLWDSGKYFVNLDGTIGHPSGEGDYPDYGGGSPPSGDDDDDTDPPQDDDDDSDDVEPPADDHDDDIIPPGDDDDDSQIDDYNVTGTPDIEFQNEPYVEGSDQEVNVPEEFLADNDDLEYEWYVEGYGFVGKGESIELDLPPGTYKLTLVGRNEIDQEVFTVSKELHIQASPGENGGLQELLENNMIMLILLISVLILIIVIFAFALGRKRKSIGEKQTKPRSPPALPIQRAVKAPIPGHGSFTPTEEIITGKLVDTETIDPYLYIEDREIATPAGNDDLGYEQMKALTEAVTVTMDKDNKGSSMKRSKAKLEQRYRAGDLDKSEFDELNEVLNRYMK